MRSFGLGPLASTRVSLRALVGARDDRILGFTMIGPEAGEVVPTVQMVMLAGRRIRRCGMQSSLSPHGEGAGSPLLQRSSARPNGFSELEAPPLPRHSSERPPELSCTDVIESSAIALQDCPSMV